MLERLFTFDSEHPLLFTQIDFWVFFLLVYAFFCLIIGVGEQRHTKTEGCRARRLWRNGYLFVVSLFFYFKTSGFFVILLIASTFLGYFLGIVFDSPSLKENPAKRGLKKWIMIVGVIANLAMLCFFKYAYFFTDIFNTIAGSHFSIANAILLPVGISFYTFQNISYIVDVYKGRVRHADNVLDFGFYTTFFPALVAGPIIRADQFIPQLYRPFHLSRRQFGFAVFWILNGLIKKIVLSDYLAVSFVDRVFDNPTLYTAFENFAALMVYSLQVYADFSGYTDIAIGVAMLMGFYLPMNFNSPYKATSPAGFWKRWHMSLSNWLKDYLYIPLGGNRKGSCGTYLILGVMLTVVALMAKTLWVTIAVCAVVALLVGIYAFFPAHRKEFNTNMNNFDTMLLGGMWHGASFNFITWGALNGGGILVYKWWKKLEPLTRIITMAILVIATCVLRSVVGGALLNMLAFAFLVIAAAVTLLELPRVFKMKNANSRLHLSLYTIWNTLLTFVFISFTRLFFRSGSNLNPAEANETAWRTATQMVGQIGSHWNLQQVPDIVSHYASVFVLFLLGMVIHLLPERLKRRYRLWFATMPIGVMMMILVVLVIFIYQFVTADLQPFIYFQF